MNLHCSEGAWTELIVASRGSAHAAGKTLPTAQSREMECGKNWPQRMDLIGARTSQMCDFSSGCAGHQ